MFCYKRLWQADLWPVPPSSSWAPGGGGGAGAGDTTVLGSWTQGRVTAHHVASFWAALGTFTGGQSLGPRESPVGGGGPEKPPTLPRFSVGQTGDRERAWRSRVPEL